MSTALATQNLKTLGDLIKNRSQAIKNVAAEHIKPERLTKLVIGTVTRTPALQKCTPETVFRSLMQCAELGLEPGSALGEAYLVPFGNECQLIPGYRGLISLAFRSGHIKSITAKTVHEGDLFTYREGLNPVLDHEPAVGVEREAGNMTHAYCVIQLMSGGVIYDVMTKKEVERIRKISKASGSGPWTQHYLEMARKTVVRRTIKYAPMSVQMAKVIALDDHVSGAVPDKGQADAYDVEWNDLPIDEETGEIIADTGPTKSDAIADKLAAEPEGEGGIKMGAQGVLDD